MAQIPFLYVNITALCAFALLFATVLASRKTREIWAFLAVLGVMCLWSMGSVFMRLQIAPGLSFWYYVSLIALFAVAPACYVFVCSFVQERTTFTSILFGLLTVVVIVITPSGLFLAPPVPEVLEGGRVVFHYTMTAWVAVPCVVLLSVVGNIALVLRKALKKRGAHYPGLIIIIVAQLVLFVGNILSILPGNVFPWDMASGIVCALMIVWALYRKRMFNLTLLVSRTLVTVLLALLFIVSGVFLIEPLENVICGALHVSMRTATGITAVLLALLMCGLFFVIRSTTARMFAAERRRDKVIGAFSSEIAKNLDLGNVTRQIVDVIVENISVNRAYVCLPDENGYTATRGSGRLDHQSITIAADSPCIAQLRENRQWLEMEEFRRSPMYQSLWRGEKELFSRDNISCILPMNDDRGIVGLILLGPVTKGNHLSNADLNFASTVASISAIAIKNASLYDEVFREARIDSLTGAYNYRYFREQIHELYKADNQLALIYVDVDDMRLYNQMYGVAEGDRALVELVHIINRCVAGTGRVFRTSGKVFAVLLPGGDDRRARKIAQEISRLAAGINAGDERRHMREVSVSCGICVSPTGASGVKELMDNADIAVFHAKASGKNNIQCFTNGDVSSAPRERAMRLVERNKDSVFRETSAAINALTAAIDAKDHYTFRHSRNVARYAAILGAAYGLNDDQVVLIYEAGLLHDIGKISIPESVLGKTEKLSEPEYNLMKQHVNNSIDMIRHLSSMDYLIPAVVSHHERWDGKGYPNGKAGEDIPLAGRCLAIADAFDAMTTDRPYRKGLDIAYAREQLLGGVGTQFDPELAYLFVQLIDRGEILLTEE